MSQRFFIRAPHFARWSSFALLLFTGLAACDTGTSVTEVGSVELSLASLAAADSQRATVGTTLPSPLAVKVVDQDQRPVAAVTVAWAVLTGSGSVGASTSTTDSSGVATVSWLLGTVAGEQRVTATLANGKVDTLVAIATAAEVQSLAVASEPFLLVPAGTSTSPLQVRAFDRYGNAVAGVLVQWSTSAGSLTASTSSTGADGTAQVQLQTASSPLDHVVRATTNGFSAEIVVRGQ